MRRAIVGRVRRLVERAADPPEAVPFFSVANRRRFEHWVWTPPGVDEPLPLVLLLHGAFDTATSMWQRGRAKETAAKLVKNKVVPPFALVIGSDTGLEVGSTYGDWADGSAYAETYVMRELLSWADETLSLNGRRHVTGISMGGYAALTLSLRHPGVFESASALSGYWDPRWLFNYAADHSDRVWAQGGADAHDPRQLVADKARRANLRIAFDCGTEDELIEQNRTFHALLTGLDVPHGYAEYRGDHDWDYWRPHLADHYRFALTNSGPLALRPR